MFIDTFKDPMVIVLLIVAIVQIVLGEAVESLIIFAVLIINSILSVVQTKKQRILSNHWGNGHSDEYRH